MHELMLDNHHWLHHQCFRSHQHQHHLASLVHEYSIENLASHPQLMSTNSVARSMADSMQQLVMNGEKGKSINFN